MRLRETVDIFPFWTESTGKEVKINPGKAPQKHAKTNRSPRKESKVKENGNWRIQQQ
jgi:hypothetical protein